MKVRALFPLAAATGFWLSGSAHAEQPAPLPATVAVANPNQSLADNVASRLRAVNAADGADINISCQEGAVTLTGSAKDAAQRMGILKAVQGVDGVVLIRNGIRVAGEVVQVQDTGVLTAPVAPQPLVPQGGPPGSGPIVEPVPLGTPGQFSPDMQAPNLPPHAWPTYAPYNNVSRVAYPTAYPYNAFPFIGPYYPFPKVPLGWRKVTLEWDDGHWYIGRNSAPQDYWRVKFW